MSQQSVDKAREWTPGCSAADQGSVLVDLPHIPSSRSRSTWRRSWQAELRVHLWLHQIQQHTLMKWGKWRQDNNEVCFWKIWMKRSSVQRRVSNPKYIGKSGAVNVFWKTLKCFFCGFTKVGFSFSTLWRKFWFCHFKLVHGLLKNEYFTFTLSLFLAIPNVQVEFHLKINTKARYVVHTLHSSTISVNVVCLQAV